MDSYYTYTFCIKIKYNSKNIILKKSNKVTKVLLFFFYSINWMSLLSSLLLFNKIKGVIYYNTIYL